MKWQQASETLPPFFANKAIAVYNDGSKQMLGYAFTEEKYNRIYICFDDYIHTVELIEGHHELSFIKWLDESHEPDHWVTLKAMFVRELMENRLITEAQLGAILNYMQKK